MVVWALFSVLATILQRLLAGLLLLSPMMELASPTRKCRVSDPRRRLSDDAAQTGVPSAVPIADLVSVPALASGFARGASHGPAHGGYCVGCCWALMLLLFVGGVMNLYVIAALTTLVAIEKITQIGELGSR